MVQIFDPLLGIHGGKSASHEGKGNPDSLDYLTVTREVGTFPAVTCIGIWVGIKSTLCE